MRALIASYVSSAGPAWGGLAGTSPPCTAGSGRGPGRHRGKYPYHRGHSLHSSYVLLLATPSGRELTTPFGGLVSGVLGDPDEFVADHWFGAGRVRPCRHIGAGRHRPAKLSFGDLGLRPAESAGQLGG